MTRAMNVARVCRWAAVALAAIAIVDPSMPWPHRARPSVRVIAGGDASARQRLIDRLRIAGFPIAADGESATIVTASVAWTPALPSPPLYVIDEDEGRPAVAIVRAAAPDRRVAGQAVTVVMTLRARGGRGSKSTVRLEDGGLAVASATHQWSAEDETWQATLSYLPDGVDARRLRVRADALPGERQLDDNVADLLAPAVRGPVRALVIESGVTWPAAFVRRALEASPGFDVASVQHATRAVATRAGSPPRGVTRSDLAPYEVVVLGQPESLDAGAFDAVRWFVERRGGVVVLVPDRLQKGRYEELVGGITFDAKTLETPEALGGFGSGLLAAELAIPRATPPLAFTLASDPSGAPIVFGVRRGMGAVIVSGALDAWRYRDRNDDAFARFWRAAVLEQASAVPPLVEVTATPSLARPDAAVRVTARLRDTELPQEGDRVTIAPASARVVNPAAHTDSVVRLWPAAEPGTFDGEWRPAVAGDYAVDVSIGGASGAAVVKVGADAAVPTGNRDALGIAARASGGGVVNGDAALVRTLTDRLPAAMVTSPSHPARSPWYAAAFALLLCGEWALRRRRGLP